MWLIMVTSVLLLQEARVWQDVIWIFPEISGNRSHHCKVSLSETALEMSHGAIPEFGL